eukprot:TRINITY_DN12719_c0_g3_i1.p1 TRINITY_DN12719_c0_g3~~TRINITY_DN12719_c0_g3_i1.p1  ORF type:complete len:213 (-),score=30.50 TRINITY_DN12719_c0_g3_i1:169-807(-)
MMKMFAFVVVVLAVSTTGQILQGNLFQNFQLPTVLNQVQRPSVLSQNQGFSLNLPTGFLEQVQAYQDEYCEPFSFEPSESVPAKFYGPSSKLIMNLGECEVHYSKQNKDIAVDLECKEPEVIFEGYPMNYTSHHESAKEFCTKECEISVPYGHITEYQETVLHIFDGSKPLDVASLQDIMSKNFEDLLDGGSFDLSSFNKLDLGKFGLFNNP